MTDTKWRASGTRIADLSFNPKGVGGLQTRRLRALKGKFGAAGKARQLNDEDRERVEAQMRRAGQLN